MSTTAKQEKQFAVMIQTNPKTGRYKWITFCIEPTEEQVEETAKRLSGLIVEQWSTKQTLMQAEIWA